MTVSTVSVNDFYSPIKAVPTNVSPFPHQVPGDGHVQPHHGHVLPTGWAPSAQAPPGPGQPDGHAPAAQEVRPAGAQAPSGTPGSVSTVCSCSLSLYSLCVLLDDSTEHLKWHPMVRQMRESILSTCVVSDTQTNQSSDLPNWRRMLRCYVNSHLLSDQMLF